MIFSSLIDRLQNPRHFLIIVFTMSLVLSISNLNILGIVFGTLGLVGIRKTKIGYLKAFLIYCNIEFILYLISTVFFIILLVYDIYLITGKEDKEKAPKKNLDELDEEDYSNIFGLTFIYMGIVLSFFIAIFKLFVITLLKKYLREVETSSEFARLESGKDIRYPDTKLPMVSEKENTYSYDSNNNDYNLPQYTDH